AARSLLAWCGNVLHCHAKLASSGFVSDDEADSHVLREHLLTVQKATDLFSSSSNEAEKGDKRSATSIRMTTRPQDQKVQEDELLAVSTSTTRQSESSNIVVEAQCSTQDLMLSSAATEQQAAPDSTSVNATDIEGLIDEVPPLVL
ncbi:unnamed protein product, partial [Amoebophrya sp. A25]